MTAVPISSRRTRRPPDTRAAILRAALALFTRRGVAGTSIQEIRDRAGASTGSVYHHFGSKQGIAAALVTESLADYQRRAVKALDVAAGARAGVEALVRHHVAWVVADPDRARFLLMAREPGVEVAVTGQLRAQNKLFFAAIERWLAQQPELRSGPRDVLYALWLGPTQELTRQWLGGSSRQEPTAFTAILAGAALRALTNEED